MDRSLFRVRSVDRCAIVRRVSRSLHRTAPMVARGTTTRWSDREGDKEHG